MATAGTAKTKLVDGQRIGISTGQVYPNNTASIPKVSNSVDASKLDSAVIPKFEPTNTNTANTKLSTDIQGFMGANETTPATPSTPDPRAGIQSRLAQLIGIQGGQGDEQTRLLEEQKVADKQLALQKLDNQIAAKSRAYELKVREIQKNKEGKFAGAVEQDVATVERQANQELADLAIQRAAADGDINTALNIVQTKIDAKYEPIQNEINSLQQLYGLYQNDLSESEKIQVNAAIQEKQSQLDFQRKKEYASYEQQLQQSDPLYQAQLLKAQQATIPGLNQKPLTAAQSKALGYAQRTVAADAVIREMGNKFTGVENYVTFSDLYPNTLKSSDQQRYEQAQRDFVNAILRPESGAVINPEEFINARKQYFPQPGDSQQVVDQKASNRALKIQGLFQEANTQNPAFEGDIIQDAAGNQFMVGPDGELTPIQ